MFTLSCFITVHHVYKKSGSRYPLMRQLKTAVTIFPWPYNAEQIQFSQLLLEQDCSRTGIILVSFLCDSQNWTHHVKDGLKSVESLLLTHWIYPC